MDPRDDRSSTTSNDSGQSPQVARRRLLTLCGASGIGLLAGCMSTSETGGIDLPSPSDASGEQEGTFRLLISDRPNAIDDFGSLEVSFDHARVFPMSDELATDTDEATSTVGESNESETVMGNETATDSPTEAANATANGAATETDTNATTRETTAMMTTASAEGEGAEAVGGDDIDDDGFMTIALEGKTVDLTEVVGTKATGISEAELPAGRYTKIELHVETVEGLVDGASVDVMVPSGKLMLTKPFTIESGSTLDFVFDISVVKKGNGGYNLLPVIGESGVAGRDVEVEEVEKKADSNRENGSDGQPNPAESEADDDDEEKPEEPPGESGNDRGGNVSGAGQGNQPPDESGG